MRDGGGGSIVQMASISAHTGGSPTCAYAASKAALINLTRSMAIEWAPWNVRVNVVSPGTFRTDMTTAGAGGDEYLHAMAQRTFLKRIGEPRDMVGPVLYLASDASSFVTGDELTVSGGRPR
jgi:gluconate 5-dehydrogenase/2-deoxy-D-gluconate 3-dehydrogenase